MARQPRRRLAALVLGATSLVPIMTNEVSASTTSTLYAATGSECTPSSLYTLDPATAAPTLVGAITVGGQQVDNVDALAVHPVTGTLYGVMNSCGDVESGTLLSIDKATGVATVVGTPDSLPLVPDMAFDPFGDLYAWAAFGAGFYQELAVVDTGSGVASHIGTCDCSSSDVGLAIDSTGRIFKKSGWDMNQMSAQSGASFGYLGLQANEMPSDMLAFDEADLLYTGTRTGAAGFDLQTIDIDTGVVSTVGTNSIDGVSALAFAVALVPPPAADLWIDKEVDVTSAVPGDTVEFTITVTNDGPADATGVVVDDVPSGFIPVGDDGAGAFDPLQGIWTVGDLANGASATLTVTATVHTSGDYTNAARIIASDQFDPDSVPGEWSTDEDDDDEVSVDVAAADSVPPSTSILWATPGRHKASFAFTGDDDVSVVTFECRIDGGAYSTCTSPTSFSAITGGRHLLEVRAVDEAGNVDPTPSSVSVRVKGSPNRTS
jgi:uncharacterized repeat protein (TIGR01451 family)